MLWILSLCMFPAMGAETIDAWFDRNPIALGETVTLTVEVAQDVQEKPDLEPLAENFAVRGTSTNTQVQIINGRQSATTQWLIELEPKRSGELQVPPLRLNGNQTPSLSLTVRATPTSDGASRRPGQPLFLEAEVGSQNPYVQAQVPFTVKLFYAQPVLEGSLDVPDISHAAIERLGDDVAYSTTRYGKRYNVIERHYAIFPEKSGTLTVPAIGFEGRIRSDDDWSSGYGFGFAPGRRVRLATEPVTLQVRPPPPSYSGKTWLPSPELTLEETWPQQPPRIRVGEPLTRTLILTAKGLTAAQLPAVEAPALANARIYPDKPELQTSDDGSWMVGRRQQRVAIVPTQSGSLVLPETRLVWWDTQQNSERIATLPARTITVLPALNPIPPSASPAPSERGSGSGALATAANEANEGSSAFGLSDVFWPGVSAVLLILWLMTLTAWWHMGRTNPPSRSDIPAPEAVAAQNAKRMLQRACYQGDPRTAAQALLQWAATVWPDAPPKNLGALAERLATDPTPVRHLDQALYARNSSAWQGTALWASVRQGLEQKNTLFRRHDSDLPPLYLREGE